MLGIGSIIYVGIEMGGLFTLGLGGSSLVTCGEVARVVRPSLQLLFIFLQMHFLFLTRHQAALFRGSRWANISIVGYHSIVTPHCSVVRLSTILRWLISRLGLAHLVATNLGVWLLALAREVRGGEVARDNWTLGEGVMEEAG